MYEALPIQDNNDYLQYGEEDEDEDAILNDLMNSSSKFWQLRYYAPYFNVSTFDVMMKLRKSIWPFCSKARIFVDEDIVDLFGPLWVMLTLIVEIAIISFVTYQIDIATMALELKNGTVSSKTIAYSMLKVA